jgi:hypothetical protein
MHGRLLEIVQTVRYDGSVMKAVGYKCPHHCRGLGISVLTSTSVTAEAHPVYTKVSFPTTGRQSMKVTIFNIDTREAHELPSISRHV